MQNILNNDINKYNTEHHKVLNLQRIIEQIDSVHT